VLGFDTERIHFSWISAAEGAKFQKFITEIVEKARNMGPYTAMQEIVAAD
jgi:coenzyme F420-reducing hydrogenase delta subunit